MSFFPYSFTVWQWALLMASSIIFGISKTGFSNISIVGVPLIALVFGGKESTGVLLPLICFADLFAVTYYRHHAEWKYIWRLVPWALLGFTAALITDRFVSSSRGFKILIGICIIAGLIVMIWNERRSQGKAMPPSGMWFSATFGVIGGFATLIGNAAGPIMSVFLLSVRLPKESFVGTAAWFFLIVNYLKLPLQIFIWHNISLNTLVFDLTMIPFLLLGVWLGIVLVKKVSDRQYRAAVYALTVVSAVLLFL
jgi:uncharacterized membrane protein YfcA